MTCFQLFFGKLYAEYAIKWVFLAALLIFEVGSVVSGAAPSSLALILGRAISGIGGAGLISGALIVCAYMLRRAQQLEVLTMSVPDDCAECALAKPAKVHWRHGRNERHCAGYWAYHWRFVAQIPRLKPTC